MYINEYFGDFLFNTHQTFHFSGKCIEINGCSNEVNNLGSNVVYFVPYEAKSLHQFIGMKKKTSLYNEWVVRVITIKIGKPQPNVIFSQR